MTQPQGGEDEARCAWCTGLVNLNAFYMPGRDVPNRDKVRGVYCSAWCCDQMCAHVAPGRLQRLLQRAASRVRQVGQQQ